MENVLNILRERGFVDNTTHEKELEDYLSEGQATCYIGFDPTASSLHVGHLVTIMALAHLQRNGHRPIALVGGGTGLVGDPSGKTEMRQMLTIETVDQNVLAIGKQLSRFLDFNQDRAMMCNNADWLMPLNYISFLRDVGRHFSINRMIKAESCKQRLDSEDGLSFIEFNYMILQAYDFLELTDRHDCRLQLGGSDQWGNIVAGIDLIRKMRSKTAFGITFPLITTSSGVKMGKTAKGAVWLDAERTGPYDYYQYWINTDDKDVGRFLALFTFLPMQEIVGIKNLEGAELNAAKTVLAFEATALAHGKQAAVDAFESAVNMFGAREISKDILPASTVQRIASAGQDTSVPATEMPVGELKEGMAAFKLFCQVGLTRSGGEARRLIQGGGGYINGNRVDDPEYMITDNNLENNEILLRAGKKRYHKIRIKTG